MTRPSTSNARKAGRQVAKTATPASKTPTRVRGGILPIEPILLPPVPAHAYGQARHIKDISAGDTIYVGAPQTLSVLEVAEIGAPTANGQVIVVALAVDFRHGGVYYDAYEQVTLLAGPETRIAVRST